MNKTRSFFGIALLFCMASYGYSANINDTATTESAFYANFLDRFKTTGAIASSSRFLARAITENIAQEATQQNISQYCKNALHILEVGAGDGVFTAALAEQLENARLNYYIHAVDIDDTFLAALNQRFRDNPRVIIHNVNIIEAHNASAFGYSSQFSFDAIVSGLPLYADFFSARDTHTIFENYKNLIKDGGLLRWFSYIAAPKFADIKHAYDHTKDILPAFFNVVQDYIALQSVDKSKEKFLKCREEFHQMCADFEKKCDVIDAFKQENKVRSSDAILNFPLARVHECHIFHTPALHVVGFAA